MYSLDISRSLAFALSYLDYMGILPKKSTPCEVDSTESKLFLSAQT